MEALEFVFSMLGLGMLIRWVLMHDKQPAQPTRGFFMMREPDSAPGPAEPADTTRRIDWARRK